MKKNILILLLLFFIRATADEEYQLGSGKQLARLPLCIGGYFSLTYAQTQQYQEYKADDVALLAYGEHEALSYLAEVEFKELYVERDFKSSKRYIKRDYEPYMERLYLDYTFDERFKVRLGKFNSAVGFWNLLPINVLRDTTSSPKFVYTLFPRFSTGMHATYAHSASNETIVDATFQNNNDLDSQYNNFIADKHYAFGFATHLDSIALKLNTGYFCAPSEQRINGGAYYATASLRYENDAYVIMAEGGVQKAKIESDISYALYLQALYRVDHHNALVMRLESYESKIEQNQDNIAIIGYTYRPLYLIALKAEYQWHKESLENQFLGSFSVLF